MHNPFEDLGKPRVDNPRGEEVTGAFSCQEDGCFHTAHTARYLEEVELLTWQCEDGHTSKIEEFTL